MKGINSNSEKQISLDVTDAMPLMDFLKLKLSGQSRTSIKSILTHGCVWVNNEIVTQYNHLLQPNDAVVIRKSTVRREPFHSKDLKIVYEDDAIIVVEKSEGLLSVGTDKEKKRTAYNLLNEYLKSADSKSRIYIVHRLDKDTSGVMIFAKSEEVQKKLQHNWNHSIIERNYIAVVEGAPNKSEDIIVSYLTESKTTKMYSNKKGGEVQKAVTTFSVLKKNENYSLLQLSLKTGRKNQIRVHMHSIGHPIVGDKKYGSNCNPIHRMALHARDITFVHPISGQIMKFEMPLPASFNSLFSKSKTTQNK